MRNFIFLFLILFFVKPVLADTKAQALSACTSYAQNNYGVVDGIHVACVDNGTSYSLLYTCYTNLLACSRGPYPYSLPVCVSPQILSSDSTTCVTPATCPAGQYNDTPTSCAAIPTNCTNVTGNGYFDVVSKACVTMTSPVSQSYGCYSDENICPVTGACVLKNAACSNSPSEVAAATQKAATDLVNAKAVSASNLSDVKLVADQTASAAAASASTAATLQAAVSAAGAALNDPSVVDGSQQQATLKQAFQDAVNKYAAASNAAANAAAASTAVQGSLGLAVGAVAAINDPNSSSGVVRNGLVTSNDALASAGTGLAAAKTGTSLAPTNDTKGLATDATLNALKGSVDEIKNSLKVSKGSAPTYDHSKDYVKSTETLAGTAKAGLDKLMTSPIFKSITEVFAVPFPVLNDCQSCDMSIPSIMGMPEIVEQPFCASFMIKFWAFIAAAMKVCTVFIAIKILTSPT